MEPHLAAVQPPLMIGQLHKCPMMHCSFSNLKGCWEIINHTSADATIMLIDQPQQMHVSTHSMLLSMVTYLTLLIN
jgi:hypothetical protein